MKKQNKKSGMYWHCHHDKLCEYVWDYAERVNYIKNNKPENEIKTRLRLFKKVKGKLPKEFVEAREKYVEAGEKYVEAEKKLVEAGKKYVEAEKKYNEAGEKYNEARKKYNEAGEKYVEAGEKYKPQLEALHKKECGCSNWNGKEIVFKRK